MMPKKTSPTKTLALRVPTPCSENWQTMEAREGGRFCKNCSKTVIDFSGLSDKELHKYLSSAKAIPCGRFLHSQLNRNIEPPTVKQTFIPLLYKRAAALLAFLSLKQTAVYSQTQFSLTVQPTNKKINSDTLQQPVVIAGTVKTVEGTALNGAAVLVNGIQVATADKEGRFSFEMAAPLKVSVLNFKHPEMNTVARSYHPVMGSTSYHIAMDKPLRTDYPTFVMGAPVPFGGHEDLPRLCFNKGQTNISRQMEDSLAELAAQMRNNPEGKIILIGYATKPADIQLTAKRQKAIRAYLVEKEGIAEIRIASRMEILINELKNTIEVIAE